MENKKKIKLKLKKRQNRMKNLKIIKICFSSLSLFSQVTAIKTGVKNARFLSNTAVNMTKTIKINGFTLLCIISPHNPMEKNMIK
ncbi:hypothetical protein [Treponema sp. OMZ 789]|uniref:hypothetical protein n=1 Tax=Treponema sp. OMZ 789 TaxID=2563670 RepID=UPI0020A43DE2|nr:hypothetical protein [Treponema sp. OMZ 789]